MLRGHVTTLGVCLWCPRQVTDHLTKLEEHQKAGQPSSGEAIRDVEGIGWAVVIGHIFMAMWGLYDKRVPFLGAPFKGDSIFILFGVQKGHPPYFGKCPYCGASRGLSRR